MLLAEALCALALAGILAVAAARTMSSTRRALAASESRARGTRVAVEALGVAGALLRDADSLVFGADTAVEFTLRIAHGVVCARAGAAVVLPPASAALDGLVALAQPIEPGDLARLLVRDTLTGRRHEVEARIDSVGARPARECGSVGEYFAPTDSAQSALRIVLDTVPTDLAPGASISIGRRSRLSPYYAGRGEWMLGLRRCQHGACGAVQPVAGPLRSPALSGWRIGPEPGGGLTLHATAWGSARTHRATLAPSAAGR